MPKVDIKEVLDPRTGERIKKVQIPDFAKVSIEKSLFEHQAKMNTFMVISQNLVSLLKQWLMADDDKNKSDRAVRENMRFACKKLGLIEHDPWTYNLNEKCFELRDPPDVPAPPLANSQQKEVPK